MKSSHAPIKLCWTTFAIGSNHERHRHGNWRPLCWRSALATSSIPTHTHTHPKAQIFSIETTQQSSVHCELKNEFSIIWRHIYSEILKFEDAADVRQMIDPLDFVYICRGYNLPLPKWPTGRQLILDFTCGGMSTHLNKNWRERGDHRYVI